MVNETIHSMSTHRIDGIILKLDFSKAYDSIDWSCLLHVMRCINLGVKWMSWMEAILSTMKLSILVNGSPTSEFSPIRGVRQGDSIAPYLFLLIGEVLSKLLNKAMEQ